MIERERESEWVFSSRWSHCGYTTIETLWLFFQGKKRRFFNRWSNFTKQQRERRRAFVGSLERMLVSSMLNNWKQYVKENKALRWVGRSWVTLELLLHVVKWPNCWRARAWVERHDRFSLAKLFSCKISVHDPLVALNYSCNLEPFANTENWFLLSWAIEWEFVKDSLRLRILKALTRVLSLHAGAKKFSWFRRRITSLREKWWIAGCLPWRWLTSERKRELIGPGGVQSKWQLLGSSSQIKGLRT